MAKTGTLSNARGDGARLNRIILLLNVGVLVVNFVLALQMTDSQIGLLRTTAEAGNVSLVRSPTAGYADAALPYVRVLQALEGITAGQDDAFDPTKLRAILDAVHGYQTTMESGVTELINRADADEDLRQVYVRLGKSAREEVEITLGRRFSDPQIVRRLATEVIRACQ